MIMKTNDFKKIKPKNGQSVIWVWFPAGIVYVGDYFQDKVRLAITDYQPTPKHDIEPTHWICADKFWDKFE